MKRIYFIMLALPIFVEAQQNTGLNKVLQNSDAIVQTAKSIGGLFKKKEKQKPLIEEKAVQKQTEIPASVISSAQGMEFYDLLLMLIPDTGKTKAVTGLDKNIKAIKWNAPHIDGIYNTLSANAQIVYNNEHICEGYCTVIELHLDKAVKTYDKFNIDVDIHDQEISEDQILKKFLGTRSYELKRIQKGDAFQYELSLQGKIKVWVDVMFTVDFYGKQQEQELPHVLLSVYFSKEDLP
ncbi:hypothetical protein [Chryseobacterium gambrini]|uniref:hypothetical protein n=1 Tax=Chryseobacterium gambrini TaxID=373672 RepID=UPI003D109A85